MSLRDILHTILNRLSWTEEAELIDARKAVDDEFAPQDEEDNPPSLFSGIDAGVKDADGNPVKNPE